MICPKCKGDGKSTPCAYPDFNFRDCGMRRPVRRYLVVAALCIAIVILLALNPSLRSFCVKSSLPWLECR